VPRSSLERLRTLEFALESAQEPAIEVSLAPEPAVPEIEPAGARWRPRLRRFGPIAAIAAVILAMGAVVLSRGGGPAESGARSAEAKISQALKPEAEVAAAPRATESPTITVSLRNVPKNAVVSIDGQPGSGDTLELPRDGRNRVIRVTSPGMVPWQVVHHASADAAFEVALVKDDTLRQSQRPRPATEPVPSGGAASAPKKVHKKPPSALRKLDF
jgi:hypothetical protein